MANVTAFDGKFLSVDHDGAVSWDLTTSYQVQIGDPVLGIKVKSIGVFALTGVIIIVRNTKVANQTSPKIVHFVASTGQLSTQYTFEGGVWMWPALDATDCGAGTVVFELG